MSKPMPEPSPERAEEPHLHLVLFRPEILQNTGNVGRLAAYTGARLHLIKPLGFTITDRHLRRSGMDYWHSLDLHEHEDWAAFRASPEGPKRLWLLSTRGPMPYWEASFEPGDGLLFGQESSGLPEAIHEEIGDPWRVTLPRYTPELRSLNLATSVGIAAYEALRQFSSAGLISPR